MTLKGWTFPVHCPHGVTYLMPLKFVSDPFLMPNEPTIQGCEECQAERAARTALPALNWRERRRFRRALKKLEGQE